MTNCSWHVTNLAKLAPGFKRATPFPFEIPWLWLHWQVLLEVFWLKQTYPAQRVHLRFIGITATLSITEVFGRVWSMLSSIDSKIHCDRCASWEFGFRVCFPLRWLLTNLSQIQMNIQWCWFGFHCHWACETTVNTRAMPYEKESFRFTSDNSSILKLTRFPYWLTT